MTPLSRVSFLKKILLINVRTISVNNDLDLFTCVSLSTVAKIHYIFNQEGEENQSIFFSFNSHKNKIDISFIMYGTGTVPVPVQKSQ